MFVFFFFLAAVAAAELALKRKLLFPVSRTWQRWVSRSSSAVVILASPNTVAHSLKLKLVVMTTQLRALTSQNGKVLALNRPHTSPNRLTPNEFANRSNPDQNLYRPNL